MLPLIAGKAGLEQEVRELVQERLEIDRVGHLRRKLAVGMKAHGEPPPSVIPPGRPECHPSRLYIASVPAPTTLNPFRVVLRHRNFRLFLIGQTLSLIGTWMQSMSEGWLALELSNSAFIVGLVASAQALPILLLSLHAGVIVDRNDKLRIVRIAQTLLSIQAGTLWWLTWSHHLTIGWLLTLALANGMIVSFEIPARQSLIVDLVGREDLPAAIALNSSGFNIARVVGPTIGALIIAQFGIAWCFGVNA